MELIKCDIVIQWNIIWPKKVLIEILKKWINLENVLYDSIHMKCPKRQL
jgi:hypothetical protein